MKKYILIILLIAFLPLCAFAFGGDDVQVLQNSKGIVILKLDGKKVSTKLKPHIEYTTANDLYNTGNFKLVVNGGFFDMKNQNPVSYVVIDKVTVETPYDNEPMIQDLSKKGRLEAVLNRSEFRILENKRGKISYDITPHSSDTPKNKTIKHSIQGGPLIYPTLEWEKESFVIFDNDTKRVIFETCDVTKRRERTMLGLKGDNIYIILFTKKHKIALNEAYDYCKKHLKLNKIMALDGGGSTSLYYKDIKVFSEGTNGRKVKSFLVLEGDKNWKKIS